MTERRLTTDICVIGAGAAGLTLAAGAAAFGAETVLIERASMGGECLNTGCIPSKALVAAARRAGDIADAARFGLSARLAPVDLAAVMDWVQQPIADIAPQDSAARFESLGVRVIRAAARFADDRMLLAGEWEIRARRFVVATGSRPAIPEIPGLHTVSFLTNETIFSLRTQPAHLIVLGGGASGVEFAHAFARLGTPVSLIERHRILGGEDPDAVALVRQGLLAAGVALFEEAVIEQATQTSDGVRLSLRGATGPQSLTGSHLLVAAGRRADVEGLCLDKAGVTADSQGIPTGPDLRTRNRRIYAVGDVLGRDQFTHAASAEAARVLQAILFRLPASAPAHPMPRSILADPELLQVGLTEAQAREKGLLSRVVTTKFRDNDAAVAAGLGDGFVKIVLGRRSRIIGATAAGRDATQLAAFWTLAVERKLRLSSLRPLILPYPSLGETARKAALAEAAPLARGRLVRWLVRFLARFG